jgi:ArsR family transcriptional regulator, arsenate/arsenite/antimonite-responsive transcriptional repressor
VALTRDLELLAHPVRLRLLSVLARNVEPVCVCDLEALVPVKQPTVSHHLRILRDAGLIMPERRGLWTYYSVREAGAAELRKRIRQGLASLTPIEGPNSPKRG